MPTYGITDAEAAYDVHQENGESYFRRFMGSSMKVLRVKKFSKEHQEALEVDKEIENIKTTARVAALNDFDEKRRRFFEKFQSTSNASNVIAQVEAAQVEAIKDAWMREYEEPSSSASIVVHDEIKDNFKPSSDSLIGNTSMCNMSFNKSATASNSYNLNESVPSSLFDNTARSSLFNTSEVFGKSTTPAKGEIKFNLDVYTGGRPSFAPGVVMTSTPHHDKKLLDTAKAPIPLIEESFEETENIVPISRKVFETPASARQTVENSERGRRSFRPPRDCHVKNFTRR